MADLSFDEFHGVQKRQRHSRDEKKNGTKETTKRTDSNKSKKSEKNNNNNDNDNMDKTVHTTKSWNDYLKRDEIGEVMEYFPMQLFCVLLLLLDSHIVIVELYFANKVSEGVCLSCETLC